MPRFSARFFLCAGIVGAAVVPFVSFASYLPGETLNPSCLPTDPSCVVVANTADSFIATSTTATSTFAGNVSVAKNFQLSGGLLTVWGPDASSNTSAFSVVNSASTTEFQVFDNGDTNVSGSLSVGSTSKQFLGQAVNAFGGLQFAIAQNGLGNPSGTMSGYSAGDTITLQCTGVTFSVAPVVGVSAASAGQVSGSVISNPGVTTGVVPSGTVQCSQASTSGSGTGYQVTVTLGVIAAYIAPASLTTGGGPNNGNLLLNLPSGGTFYPISGGEDTFIGDLAGTAFYGLSDFNTAVGENACGNGGSGGIASNNTCIGNDAGRDEQGGGSNTFVGSGAGRNNAGSGNTFIGLGAGSGAGDQDVPGTVTGSFNVALGHLAGENLTNPTSNVFLGSNAGASVTTGGWNTFVGQAAGDNRSATSTGYNNVFVGFNSGNAVTSGSGNTFVGTKAGSSITTGSGDIILSATAGGDNCNTAGNVSDYFAVCPGAGPVFTITGSGAPGTSEASLTGSLAIGTTTPYSRLTVWGSDSAATTSAFSVVNAASTTVFAVYDNGNATYAGSIFQSSDERLKTNVTSLDASSSLSDILALNPVSYTRLDQPGTGENLGFIAQQVGKVFPELVSTTSATKLTPGGTLTLNYVGLISPLVKAVQNLAGRVSSLEQTVAGFAQSVTTNILTAATGHFSNQLCVGSTCVTPAQFEAMVAASQQHTSTPAAASVSTSPATTTATTTPPQLSVNGANPAKISVGDTYSDLGATITGPAGDLNLGIKASVDGGATTTPAQIVVDTKKAGSHIILYCATDQQGLSGCASRTLEVKALQNDAASSTEAASSTPVVPPVEATSSATSTGA